MTDGKEKLEVLNMIREGKITPEQGVRLIEALDKAEAVENPGVAPSGAARWLNIEIKSKSAGKYKSLTPIRIPLSLVKLFFRFIPKDSALPGSDSSIDEVMKTLETGKPIEFHSEDGEEGRSIRIVAE
ncbi:MAG TPA: hypothetical protein PKH33_12910 [bacterium]|nr:hypothetical protein [bacterium]